MRKKALLAGATSSFEGPWVSLEEGEWVVEPGEDVVIRVEGETVEFGEGRFIGPTKIRAIVSPDYSGDGIFLVAKQITAGGDKP